jgi:hypothetical protein
VLYPRSSVHPKISLLQVIRLGVNSLTYGAQP